MTDGELISRVIGMIDPGSAVTRGLRRNGRLLLALPDHMDASERALSLYQPQRPVARLMVTALRGVTHLRLLGCVLPKVRITSELTSLSPPLSGVEPGTCGVLLGSPEHRVRRAIASYRKSGGWEVAKISFGDAGAQVLEQESQVLEELQSHAKGAPPMLGLHRGESVTLLRMPYLTGRPLEQGRSAEALRLLEQWITGAIPVPVTEFPEWIHMESALSGSMTGSQILEHLSQEILRPVIRHGDFARWNLLQQQDGSLMALDWEWGHMGGMPGMDLVHYFLQDERLVRRRTHTDAIAATIAALNRPECADYLARTGWSGNPMLPIIACLAWKQGAGHQENGEVLDSALAGWLLRR